MKSEFLCDFIWTDEGRRDLEGRLLDWRTKQQIRLVRFTVPVLGFNNPYLSMSNYSGTLTWTWVPKSHVDMLYFPHNFIVLSGFTISTITRDWVIDSGHCDPQCVQVNKSCGIGKYELEEILTSVTKGKFDITWSFFCLQSPYPVLDIVKTPNYAFPDLLYYWRFLYKFFSKIGWVVNKTDFPNYYCYHMDNCYVEELLSSFWVIPFVGFLLWLYSPLLIYYFPSSTPRRNRREHKGMISSHKHPMYLGRCLKCMLCFYKEEGMPGSKWLIRLRRLLFLGILAVSSFRLFIWPPYYYYSWPLLVCAMIAVSVPSYLSTHITAEIPSRFLFWELPEGLMYVDKILKEYQKLARVMQERIYLTVNVYKFWPFVFQSSFYLLRRLCCRSPKVVFLVVSVPALVCSSIIFATAVIVNMLFYFVPLPYFYFTLLLAVLKEEYEYVKSAWKKPFWFVIKFACALFHGVVMVGLVAYVFLVTYMWCYAISEFTLFIFIGCTMTPTKVFPYFVLLGSFVAAIYVMVKDLHKEYDCILETIIGILEEDKTFKQLASQVNETNYKLEKAIITEFSKCDLKYCIQFVRKGQETELHRDLLIHEHIKTYLDRDIYYDTVERCKPLRKQILFIVFKIMAIVFYCSVAFWVKNVFHMEDKVGAIFEMVQAVAILMVPIILQFISYKNNGKNKNIVLRQEIYESLVTYLSNLDFNLYVQADYLAIAPGKQLVY